VRWDIHVDLAALQAVLLEELTVVFGRHVSIASLHEGIPQQHGEAVMVQTPRVQLAILKGAVLVVSHLRQKLGNVRIFKEEIFQHDSKYQKRPRNREPNMTRSKIQALS
jgi:hypothetical protein